MNKYGFRIGPGAASIILVIVVVTMSILGVLALSEAKTEKTLSEKSTQFVKEANLLEYNAQFTVMQLDEIISSAREQSDFLSYIKETIPENVSMMEDRLSFETSLDGSKFLEITIRILPDTEDERFEYVSRRIFTK